MASLPIVEADPSIKEVCESVSLGHISVTDGIQYVQDRVSPVLLEETDTNKITVLAVLLVEKLIPTSQGVFLSLEELDAMWNQKEPIIDANPKLHMTFLVLSCMQLTTVGPMRNGIKSMTQVLDKILPEPGETGPQNGMN